MDDVRRSVAQPRPCGYYSRLRTVIRATEPVQALLPPDMRMERLSVDPAAIGFYSSASFIDVANDTDRMVWHPMQDVQYRAGVDPGGCRAHIL